MDIKCCLNVRATCLRSRIGRIHTISLALLPPPPSQLFPESPLPNFSPLARLAFCVCSYFGNLFDRCTMFGAIVELHFKNYLLLLPRSNTAFGPNLPESRAMEAACECNISLRPVCIAHFPSRASSGQPPALTLRAWRSSSSRASEIKKCVHFIFGYICSGSWEWAH